MSILTYLKQFFSKKSYIKNEQQLYKLSKDALEIYARTLGLELDKRYNKDTLIKQILSEQKYQE